MSDSSSDSERDIWLVKTARSMLVTRELRTLLPMVADTLMTLTQAERCFILLRNRESGLLTQSLAKTALGNEIPFDKRVLSLANRVLKEKKAIFSGEVQHDGVGSAEKFTVYLPLATDTDVVGVTYLDGQSKKPLNGNQRQLLESVADFSAAAIDNARMFERATNDPLTGLPNNSYFLMQLAKAMLQANEEKRVGILLLDVDAFKRVNNAAGAEMGDRALLDIAVTLQDVLRADGLVARYGSDKFGILLPPDETTSIGVRLRDCAERARAAIATKVYHGLQMSACIGGVGFPGNEAKLPADLIAIADDVLAKARARGPGEVEIA
jgi:diguanylate cyclase (GGDEF)-like protein